MEKSFFSTLAMPCASAPARPTPRRCERGSKEMKVMGITFGCKLGLGSLALAAVALASAPARAEVSAETAFVLNTFSFLVGGFLVMWISAGFAMLEAGLGGPQNSKENGPVG